MGHPEGLTLKIYLRGKELQHSRNELQLIIVIDTNYHSAYYFSRKGSLKLIGDIRGYPSKSCNGLSHAMYMIRNADPKADVDGAAYFIFNPRNEEDFNRPYPVEQEKPFSIIGSIALRPIDYENFVADMLVEREYLEPYEDFCGTGNVYSCVLVHKEGNPTKGYLVIPDSGGYIECAAYYDEQ